MPGATDLLSPALFEHLAVGLLVLDHQGRIADANPAAHRLLRCAPQSLVGRMLAQLEHPADSARDTGQRAELVAGRISSYRTEKRLREPGDPPVWIRFTLSRLPPDTPDGEPRLLAALDDVSAQRRSLAALEQAALTDELTGLHNRRGFYAIARQQLKVAARGGRTLVLIFLDLDDFKRINDTYGHAHGDHILVEAARLVRAVCRDSDVLARIGGDEFVILTPDTSEQGAEVLLDRIATRVEAWNETWCGPGSLSFSIGTVQFEPGSHGTLEDLLATADRRMYQKKRELPWIPGSRPNKQVPDRED